MEKRRVRPRSSDTRDGRQDSRGSVRARDKLQQVEVKKTSREEEHSNASRNQAKEDDRARAIAVEESRRQKKGLASYDESLTMCVPLTRYTRFSVTKDKKSKVVTLTIRRPYGFAIELVIDDSPLMVSSFLEAFEDAVSQTEILDRIEAMITPVDKTSKQQSPTLKKSGPTIPTGLGVERPKRRSKQ